MYPRGLNSQTILLRGPSSYARSSGHRRKIIFKSDNQHTPQFTISATKDFLSDQQCRVFRNETLDCPSYTPQNTETRASNILHLTPSPNKSLGRSAREGTAVLT